MNTIDTELQFKVSRWLDLYRDAIIARRDASDDYYNHGKNQTKQVRNDLHSQLMELVESERQVRNDVIDAILSL